MLSFFVTLAVLGPRYGADSRLRREASVRRSRAGPRLVAGLVSPRAAALRGQLRAVAEEGGDAAHAG